MHKAIAKIVDPHLHFFNLQQGEYAWLKPQNPPFWEDKHLINKSFSESDLTLHTPLELAGFVHIEAGFDNQQPWREIDWLQQHCRMPFKTMAYADISDSSFKAHLTQLQQRNSVTGIRNILDEQANKVLSSSRTRQHFALLAEMKFCFDVQLSLTDCDAISHLITLANSNNTIPIIINHAGWPPLRSDVIRQKKWQLNLQKLARCNNIAIKLSGWEMSNRHWKAEHVATVVLDCIATLGDTRVMLASNFPLCLLTIPYPKIWDMYANLQHISAISFERISYSNALNWYNF
ncbi:amidohydrolase [uncultured Paraglaciecola sp.]|uniref:amidohydrolase family protein n=1 Tax=uncultured Paraglaciecola sp. TaxID=1765024 RepID=UPI002610E010|nr:amidohydrolase family protein [uncultured Paraglaciecola sp.]